ncbi:MAG TPA: 6-phosphogluconolactonase [Candidatus Enterocloster excrementipullorum]|uniref:6-phosphogluconolactonase n=1 Tax=Candidatus Enterocloster excrementipullorum TaxID=2838559 RepID=A0A9D2MXZ5_9FIRM|nr:6-phosphogluconolactonase [Candidatus Enterocloster excrementipullorum]
MKIVVEKNAELLGLAAARNAAAILQAAIQTNGCARIVLSTGASQFEFLSAFIKQDVDWSKVEMFHLDEYVGLPETHIASFRKYLKERFVSQVPLKAAYFVNGEGDVENNIAQLSQELLKAPVDLGLIGIGENGHIAFNDPPADLEDASCYKVVHLNDRCKQQQVNEGWFATLDDVPECAISMTVQQILKCRHIISVVPNERKAEAVKNTLAQSPNAMVPATQLKTHPNWSLYIDSGAASQIILY